MVTKEQNLPYFKGVVIETPNKRHHSECVITAILNYLIEKGTDQRTLQDVQTRYQTHLSLAKKYLVATTKIPLFIEQMMGRDIEATLYLASNISTELVPPQDIKKIKSLPKGLEINSFPFIGCSDDDSHLFVVSLKGKKIVTIDNDGQIHDGLRYSVNDYVGLRDLSYLEKLLLSVRINN